MKSLDERKAQRREIRAASAEEKAPQYQAGQVPSAPRGRTPSPEVVLPEAPPQVNEEPREGNGGGGSDPGWSPNA